MLKNMFFNGKYARHTFAIPLFSTRHRESCKMPPLRASEIEMAPPQPHSELHTPVTIMTTLAVYLFYIPRAHSNNQSTPYALNISKSKETARSTQARSPTQPVNRRSKSEGNRVRAGRRSRTLHRRNRSCGAFLWGISKASSKTSSASASASASAASSAAARSSGERISGGGGELPCAMPDQTTPAATARGTFVAGETTPRDRTGERNPPLRATQTRARVSPRDRRER